MRTPTSGGCLLLMLTAISMLSVLGGAKIHAMTTNSNWIAATQGWNSPANWSPNGVPDSSINPGNFYNVTIDNGAGPTVNSNAEINRFSIRARTGESPGLIDTNSKTLIVDQRATNWGLIEIQNGSRLLVKGDLANSGELDLDEAGGSPDTRTAGTLGGITDIAAGSRFSVSGAFSAGSNSAFANLQSVEGELKMTPAPESASIGLLATAMIILTFLGKRAKH